MPAVSASLGPGPQAERAHALPGTQAWRQLGLLAAGGPRHYFRDISESFKPTRRIIKNCHGMPG